MKQWLRFIFSRAFLKTAVAAAVVVVVGIFGSLYWLKSTTMHGHTVEIPDLKLMPLAEAQVLLEEAGLTYEVIDSTHYAPGIPEGAIVDCFPEAYSKVKLGRKILLSTNPSSLPKYPLPNYKDQLVSYVSSKFKTKGFEIDSIVMVPDLSHDLVLKVLDENGALAVEQQPYETGAHFTLYVSAGQDGRTVYLPSLVGLKVEEAQALLTSLSLNTGALVIREEIKDTMAAFVMQSAPAFEPELEVPVGSAVDLWLVADSADIPQQFLNDSLDVNF